MDISARSYLTAGISLTAATAIAFTPLAIPALHPTVTIPHVITSDINLTVSPSDVAGVPGQALIAVATTIETLFDVGFSGLIDATDDPTLAASLTILKTLSVDAYAMLAHNLGRINPVITGTTTEVGSLLTTALTGSLENVLIAGYGLAAVQSLGDAAFDIAGIAVDELTFQFNNAVSGLSALATQLGDASGSTTVGATIKAVQGLAVAPVVGVVNLGVGVTGGVLTTANAGFSGVLAAATDVVQQPELTERSVSRSFELESVDSSASDDDVTTTSFLSDDVANDDVPVVEETGQRDAAQDTDDADGSVVEDATDDAGISRALHEAAANDDETPDKDAAPDHQSGDTGADNSGTGSTATDD